MRKFSCNVKFHENEAVRNKCQTYGYSILEYGLLNERL